MGSRAAQSDSEIDANVIPEETNAAVDMLAEIQSYLQIVSYFDLNRLDLTHPLLRPTRRQLNLALAASSLVWASNQMQSISHSPTYPAAGGRAVTSPAPSSRRSTYSSSTNVPISLTSLPSFGSNRTFNPLKTPPSLSSRTIATLPTQWQKS